MTHRLLLTFRTTPSPGEKGQKSDPAQSESACRVHLFSSFRRLAALLEILHNCTGTLQLLLPPEQTSLTPEQSEWLTLPHTRLFAGYACESINSEELQRIRLEVLASRIQGIKTTSNLSVDDVKETSMLRQERNGVQHWSHDNVHYLIALGQVYTCYGFWGETLFNWLAHGRAIYDLEGEQWWF